MTIKESIAKLQLGEITLREFPKIALKAIESGIESKSLLILAGMKSTDNEFEIKEYLDNVIDELSITIQESLGSAYILANSYVNSYKKGEFNIIQCIYNIKNECWDNCQNKIDSIDYLYDGIKFEKIIGPWFEYNEIDQFTDWVKKSNKSLYQIKKEIEKDLETKVLNWQFEFLKDKIDNLSK